MLTEEDDVEIHALAARGWKVSEIARHTGRDRKTVAKYLKSEGAGQHREPAPSCLEPFRAYIEARLVDDPHLDATVLHRELAEAGFDRSYPTLVRELRRLELRPVCWVCEHHRGQAVTVEIDHPAGEEIQWDWLELHETPWGQPAFLLLGALSHSGRFRGVFCEQMTFGHLAEAMHRVLVALGGTPRVWRTDRMATIVVPGTDRLTTDAAQAAKHYGVEVAVCPSRRAQRKGVVEAAVKYTTKSWWRSAPVTRMADAQASFDAWCIEVADQRKRPKGTVGQIGSAESLARVAARCLPRGDRRRAQGVALSAGRVRRQPLQRPARPGRAHDHRLRPRRRSRCCGSSARPARSSPNTAAPSLAPARRCARRSMPPRLSRRCWPRSRPITPAGASPTGRRARMRSPSSPGSGASMSSQRR